MLRGGRTALLVLAAALTTGATGCSFAFVRPPTPEVAREKGACEGRGIAAAADAVLTALTLYRAAAPGSALLAIRGDGLASSDVMLRST